MRILIAGVGNSLRSDDGFGVAVAERLADRDLGPGVTVIETGIGGLHLVQEVLVGYDALIVVDTADHGRPPGTVMIIEPEVPDIDEMPMMQRYDFLADMHYAKPERAFMLCRALGVLPEQFLLVGCQPVDAEAVGRELSGPVKAAVDVAITEIERILGDLRGEVVST